MPKKAILKYKIAPGQFIKGLLVMTPPKSTILSVQMMPDGIQAWALVSDMDLPETEPHYFLPCKTGDSLPDWIDDARFIGTLQYFAGKPATIKITHIFEITAEQNESAVAYIKA